MKILHTSDLHLKNTDDERWEALQHLLDVGKKESIALMVISGDMFDRDRNAESLKLKIRELFQDTGFDIAIIPGNHDPDIFANNDYFGKYAKPITDHKTPLDYEHVCIWGIPFEEMDEAKVIKMLHDISEELPEDKCNILLFHGELLDPRFSWADVEEEGKYSYMPVKPEAFANLGFDYVLAGHLHTKFVDKKIGRCFFVYPGSPVSITEKETGKRTANLLEPGDVPRKYTLDTFYYEEIEEWIDPFAEESPVEKIRNLVEKREPNCHILLNLKGYIDKELIKINETELSQEINNIADTDKRFTVKSNEVRDIGEILKDNLYNRFKEKLDGLDEDECSEKSRSDIQDMVIQAMLEVRSSK